MQLYGKKLIAALLAAMLLVTALAGCSDDSTSESSDSVSSEASSEVSSDVSGETESTSETSGETDDDTSSDYSDYDYSSGLTDDGYFEGVTALDYVTLPDYESIEIPEDTAEITDEELQTEIESRLEDYSTTEEITDREVEDGDTVNIDYVGSIDGVEFSGGSTQGEGTTVTIGETQYIDDFLDQLVGHMPGETFDIEVTFPDPYETNTDLSGKDAVFETTINYIAEETVPELTDDFVVENWQELRGWSTAAEAEEAIEQELYEATIADYLWEQVQDTAEVSEVPDSVYQYQIDTMLGYYALVADQYAVDLDYFLEYALQVSGQEELIEENKDQLEQNAESSLVMQALCESFGIYPTDEDITEFFVKTMDTSDYSTYESAYGRGYLALLTREYMGKLALAEGR